MQEKKYQISAVSYLNTKPFLFGLERTDIKDKIIISQNHPAQCAIDLLNNKIDIGLVPVAIIPLLSNPHIVSPYCIGANGIVKTVSLFSNVSLDDIQTVYLDEQSRTSVLLVQILFREFWKKEVQFLPAYPNYENQIKNNEAAVLIGDRCIPLLNQYTYNYDLAEAWKQYTNLPFVFAAWVSNTEINNNFLEQFNNALQFGLQHKIDLANEYEHYNTSYFDVIEYWTKNIQYNLDEDMKVGLELFLKKINPKQLIFYCY